MKPLTKQQALKAYLSGYAIVYEDKGKFKHYEFYIDEEKLL